MSSRRELLDPAALVQNADSHAHLVPSRLVRRVIKAREDAAGRGAGLGLQVAHARSIRAPAAEILALVDPSELELSRGLGAPADGEPISLIAAPELAHESANAQRVWVWRAVFHEAIHRAIDAAAWDKPTVHARVDALGQVAFDEAREVLIEEEWLPADASITHTLIELCAVWHELNAFAPTALPRWFPGLMGRTDIGDVLGEGLDISALFSASRPEGATAPVRPEAANPNKDTATGALRDGLLIAGPDGTPAGGAARWDGVLAPVAAAASPRRFDPARRLLADLERAERERTQPIYATHLIPWALTLGRRPLREPLPLRGILNRVTAFRRALNRVPHISLSAAEAQRLSDAISASIHDTEHDLRVHMRPALNQVFERCGLVEPADQDGGSIPLDMARHSLAERLIDRALERGFIDLGDLRDGLSQGDLKVSDLSRHDLIAGDAMIRADAALGTALPGVYRRGDVPMRGLLRLGSAAFGTPFGRFLVRFGVLPFGGAFVILEGLQHTVGLIIGALTGHHPNFMGPWRFAALAAFLLLMMGSEPARNATVRGLKAAGGALSRGARAIAGLWNHPAIIKIRAHPLARGLWRFGLRPATVAGLIGGPVHALAGAPHGVRVAAGIFVALNILTNTRAGQRLEESAIHKAARAWRLAKNRLIPGIIQGLLDAFQRVTDQIEQRLYAVDAWLRLRADDPRMALITKSLVSPIWRIFAGLTRIYINVLIEPQINPVKHFPVVTVAHKLMIPFLPAITRLFMIPLGFLPTALAATIAGTTVFLLPGAFGYLAWEFTSNWRVYGANRTRNLRPARFGHHGETLAQLLRPGFHSGTLPKAFRRLRRAHRRGRPLAVAKVAAELIHVRHAVAHLIEREFLPLMAHIDPELSDIRIGRIRLSANRIRIPILWGDRAPAVLSFAEQSCQILATLETAPWLDGLPLEVRAAIESALAGLFAKAGVTHAATCINAQLGPVMAWDIAESGLMIWPGPDWGTQVLRPLPTPLSPIPWTAWQRAWDRASHPREPVGDRPLLP